MHSKVLEVIDELDEMLDEPFTAKTGKYIKWWTLFCQITLIFRVVYLRIPFILKIILGLPLIFLTKQTYMSYLIFVVWAKFLDIRSVYNFKDPEFSIRKYFKTYMLKNMLLVWGAYFISRANMHPWGAVAYIYAIPMCFVALGYILPIFDKRIYK